MNISSLEWLVTVGVVAAVLMFDMAVISRRPAEPSARDCVIGLSAYVGLAVVFGIWVWVWHGSRFGMQFFAGWLTEYSMSVDNLFVFMLIMTSFTVPKRYQQQVLFVGIGLALVFRGVFIALGAVAIHRLSWVFYLLAGFLVYTAAQVARGREHGGDGNNAVVRLARTHLNVTDEWDGFRLCVKRGSTWFLTPMSLVVVALATTDVVFALDSIPAIYGLTSEPYLVFTANALALMGLRQLYFLLGVALKRLVYLSVGLAAVLAFIGVKLLLHALRANTLPFLNGGHPIDAPAIPTMVSLAVIAAILVVTTGASLWKTRALDAREVG